MNVYMQADFDSLTRDDNGFLYVPTGDWSNVDFGGASCIVFAKLCILGDYYRLGDNCILGERCKLGNYCKLGDGCKLEDRCRLGNDCKLGNRCKLCDNCALGDDCTLGFNCTLGDNCKLGNFCELGSRCTLGDGCKLGDECTLGDECKLGDGGSLANGKVQNATFFKTSNIGSRNDTAYCYCNTVTGDVYVRAGCWFSGVGDFIKRVRQVHAGTQHETDYLALVEFAKERFAQYRARRTSADEE